MQAAAKSEKLLKGPFSRRFSYYGLDYIYTEVFNGKQAENHLALPDRKVPFADVDVGRQHLYSHAAAFGDIFRRVVYRARHERGHKLGG